MPAALSSFADTEKYRLCLQIPYSGGRLLEGGVERFLQRRKEILGQSAPLCCVAAV
jgi:hypothetical protein